MENIKKNENFTFSENRKINLTQSGESRTSRIEPIGTKQKGPKITKISRKSRKSRKFQISRLFPRILTALIN